MDHHKFPGGRESVLQAASTSQLQNCSLVQRVTYHIFCKANYYCPVMALLFDLPEELLLSLLSSWLHMGHIAHLDSAISNHSLRRQFLRIISSPRANLLCPINVEGNMEDGTMLWIMRRRVVFSGIWITESLADQRSLWRAYLRTHGRNLKWITFIDYYCGDVDDQYYEEMLYKELVQFCPNVTKLTTATRVTTRGLSILASGLPSLLHIKMNEWSCSKRLLAFRNSCSRLKSIEMDVCMANNAQMRAFALRCPVLEEFCCASGPFLNNTFVQLLAESCPLLRNLFVSLSDLLDATLRALAENCPFLEACPLNSCFITAEAVLYLTSKCPNLKRFVVRRTLYQLWLPTDAEMTAALGKCRKLEILVLGMCDNLTDDTLLAVARCCPCLQSLYLEHFPAASDAGIISVAKACSLLQEVQVLGCARLTDASVEALMNHCPQLRLFKVDAATGISPAASTKIEKFCRTNFERCNVQYLVDTPDL